MDVFTYIIMGLLSLDTIRAIIAMTGWVKPDSRFSWIIYGRYERNLIQTALKEIGFTAEKSKRISKKLRAVSNEVTERTGISPKNATQHLIILLAKYIVKFDNPIQYGGRHANNSQYYIDTMEISHNDKNREALSAIMMHLINQRTNQSTKPNVIITPKGGNPLMTMQVAKGYEAHFLMAKSESDKSRITSVSNNLKMDFLVNYEGSWETEQLSSGKCVIVDCNISGGSQLLDIVNDIKKVTQIGDIKFEAPNEVYVLFRADDQINIDKKFSDCGSSLYRFFDLDEELKEMLYDLKCMCRDDNIEFDIYIDKVSEEVQKIITKIKEKNKFYFDV